MLFLKVLKHILHFTKKWFVNCMYNLPIIVRTELEGSVHLMFRIILEFITFFIKSRNLRNFRL